MTERLLHLKVNGRRRTVAVPDNALLIDVLRDTLALTGTKQGCDGGECGACTVIIDGKPRLACITLAATVDGAAIETIESQSQAGGMSALQKSFHEHLGTQCGFCTPGMVMAARPAAARAASRPTNRSARPWPATSAAAPATSRWWSRCAAAEQGP